MGLVFMIVVGGICGMLATFMQQDFGLRGLDANILAGVSGALLVDLLICPGLGMGSLIEGPFTAHSLLMVSLGAMAGTALQTMLRHLRIL